MGPTRFLNGLALRTTSSFLNIQCQPPTVEQHSPPPSLFLPRRPTHILQDDQANKEGRCYVCIVLQLSIRATTANKFAAVNTVPGKFHDENPISEAYRHRFPLLPFVTTPPLPVALFMVPATVSKAGGGLGFAQARPQIQIESSTSRPRAARGRMGAWICSDWVD